jgi:hypothetical protein
MGHGAAVGPGPDLRRLRRGHRDGPVDGSVLRRVGREGGRRGPFRDAAEAASETVGIKDALALCKFFGWSVRDIDEMTIEEVVEAGRFIRRYQEEERKSASR